MVRVFSFLFIIVYLDAYRWIIYVQMRGLQPECPALLLSFLHEVPLRGYSVSELFKNCLKKTWKRQKWWVLWDFTLHDLAFIVSKYIYPICMFFFIPSIPVIEVQTIIYMQPNISFFFSDFLFLSICVSWSLCHNLHELFGLWWGILTHNCVLHASIIAICQYWYLLLELFVCLME